MPVTRSDNTDKSVLGSIELDSHRCPPDVTLPHVEKIRVVIGKEKGIVVKSMVSVVK